MLYFMGWTSPQFYKLPRAPLALCLGGGGMAPSQNQPRERSCGMGRLQPSWDQPLQLPATSPACREVKDMMETPAHVQQPCARPGGVRRSWELLLVLLQHVAQRKAPSVSRDSAPGERRGRRKREGGEDAKPPHQGGTQQLAGDWQLGVNGWRSSPHHEQRPVCGNPHQATGRAFEPKHSDKTHREPANQPRHRTSTSPMPTDTPPLNPLEAHHRLGQRWFCGDLRNHGVPRGCPPSTRAGTPCPG